MLIANFSNDRSCPAAPSSAWPSRPIDEAVVAVRMEGVVLGTDVQVPGQTGERVGDARERRHLREGAVGLRRQPRGVVVGDAVGEAAPVDEPVARVVVVHVEGRALLDRLVLVGVDLGQEHHELLGRRELAVRTGECVAGARGRPHDQRPEQPHPHLLLGVGSRLVQEGTGLGRDEGVGDGATVGGGHGGQRGQCRTGTLGLCRLPVCQHSRLAGEDDRRRLRQGVVEDHRDRVALVDAQHRAGVLERVEPVRVSPHECGVGVGQADVAGLGRQVEDRTGSFSRGADDSDP